MRRDFLIRVTWNSFRSHEPLANGSHGAGQSFGLWNPCLPAQGRQPAHIQLFLRGAIGLAEIARDRAAKARGGSDMLGQLTDAQI